MGLGKTLQSICIVAGDHYDRQQKYKVKYFYTIREMFLYVVVEFSELHIVCHEWFVIGDWTC